MAKRIDEADIPPLIARKIAARASGADEAIVVGTRAGVIEWANAAWTKVTGHAVDDAISKPIGWLLDAADIEPAVVDFVQRHFLAGKRCEIEFPVDTPDGRSIWLHLDVEPFADTLGEISDFVAMATDITARRKGEIALESRIEQALNETDADALAPEIAGADRATLAADIETLELRLALTRISETLAHAAAAPSSERPLLDHVSVLAHDALQATKRHDIEPDWVDVNQRINSQRAARIRDVRPTIQLDFECSANVPQVIAEPAGFDEIVGDVLDSAIDEIGGEWGTISITTGVAEAGLSLPSSVDPTIDRYPLTRDRAHVFVEIHDTALALSRDALRWLDTRESQCPPSARMLVLALARARAERLGGALSVHGTAGVGTRVVLYLPIG